MVRLQWFRFSLLIVVGAALSLTPALAAPAASAPSPFTVTDALGRKVSFAKPPQRVAIAGRGLFMISDAAYLFPEAAQRLVALGPLMGSGRDFLPLVDAKLGTKLLLDPGAGAEQIVPSRPDVVILKSGMALNLGPTLERLKIPVVYVDLETPPQYERDLRVLGQILQDPGRAEAVCRYYQEQAARVQKAVAGIPEAHKPRVLVLQCGSKSSEVGFSVPAASWIQTTMVTLAGGIPVWTEASKGAGWTVVSLEQIAAWNPDQVYVVRYRGNVQGFVAKLRANPQWQALKAVKQGKLFGFPADFSSWDQPDTRWPLGLLWLAARIHPERLGSVRMADEVARFYTELYGLPPDVIRGKVMPLLQGRL